MKQFKIFAFIAFGILISSCGTIKEGFKSQKKNNSDEFLVEKKSPLVMPPDFNELPVPQEKNVTNEKDEEDEIKKLISNNEDNKIENDIVEKNQTFEDSLLKKIKDN